MPKTLFIDSTPDIDRLWKRVHRARTSPWRSTWGPWPRPTSPAAPGLRHLHRRCHLLHDGRARPLQWPEAHRLPWHRRGELHRPGRRRAARHQGLHHQGLRRHGGGRACHGPRVRRRPPHRHHAQGAARRRLAGDAGHGAERQDVGADRPRRHRPRDGAPGQGHRPCRRSPSTARPWRMPLCRWWPSTSCSRARTSSSVHLGLNDATRHFLDRARLQKLKPGGILVNTARAGVVDEAALIDLLRSGHIGHYATDVFAQEPPRATSRCAARQRHADGAFGLQHARGGDDHVSPRHRPRRCGLVRASRKRPMPRRTRPALRGDGPAGGVAAGGGQRPSRRVPSRRGGEPRHLREWMPIVATRHPVARFDMRGFGRSVVPRESHPWSMHEMIADLLEVAETAFGRERVHVMGESIGGTIALAAGLAQPRASPPSP